MTDHVFTGSAAADQPRSLLRTTLLVNSLVSGISGLVFAFGAEFVAAFMGVATPLVFVLLGLGLLVFAAGVYYVASRPIIDPRYGWLIFELDVAWIIGSVIILATNAFALSEAGRWTVLILADVVLLFAIGEFIGLRRLRRS
jgi:hypothetical protein